MEVLTGCVHLCSLSIQLFPIVNGAGMNAVLCDHEMGLQPNGELLCEKLLPPHNSDISPELQMECVKVFQITFLLSLERKI